MGGDDHDREVPLRGDGERSGAGGCGGLTGREGPRCTGIHRANIVRPSTAMATRMPTAVQASAFRLKIRKATHTDSPVAARPRWVKMIGTGSLLGVRRRGW